MNQPVLYLAGGEFIQALLVILFVVFSIFGARKKKSQQQTTTEEEIDLEQLFGELKGAPARQQEAEKQWSPPKKPGEKGFDWRTYRNPKYYPEERENAPWQSEEQEVVEEETVIVGEDTSLTSQSKSLLEEKQSKQQTSEELTTDYQELFEQQLAATKAAEYRAQRLALQARKKKKLPIPIKTKSKAAFNLDSNSLRQAVVVAEILMAPLALRASRLTKKKTKYV